MPPSTAGSLISRGVRSNALSFVLRFGARISFLYLAARLFGAASYGVFSLAVAVVELAVPVAGLGLKRMVFPWLEENGDRPPMHVVLDALLLSACAGTLVAGTLALVAWSLPGSLISESLRLALILLAPAIIGQAASDIALAATRFTHRMRYEVFGRGLIEPYVGTFVALAAWQSGLKATGLLLGYAAGTVALLCFALWSARTALGPFALGGWRNCPAQLWRRFRIVLPASFSDVVSALSSRADLYLVGILLSETAAGIYSVVRQVRSPILQVRQAFDGILVPLIAKTMRADGDVVTGAATAAATRIILAIQLAIVLIMAAAGHHLLGLFGQQYVVGYVPLLFLALSETVSGAFGLSELIIYYRRPALALAINAGLICVSAVLIAILSARWQLPGVAAATLISAFAGTLVRRYALARMGVKRQALHAMVPVGAAALAVAGAAAAWFVLAGSGAGRLSLEIAPAVTALGIYGIAISAWRKARPEALSLRPFRTR